MFEEWTIVSTRELLISQSFIVGDSWAVAGSKQKLKPQEKNCPTNCPWDSKNAYQSTA